MSRQNNLPTNKAQEKQRGKSRSTITPSTPTTNAGCSQMDGKKKTSGQLFNAVVERPRSTSEITQSNGKLEGQAWGKAPTRGNASATTEGVVSKEITGPCHEQWPHAEKEKGGIKVQEQLQGLEKDVSIEVDDRIIEEARRGRDSDKQLWENGRHYELKDEEWNVIDALLGDLRREPWSSNRPCESCLMGWGIPQNYVPDCRHSITHEFCACVGYTCEVCFDNKLCWSSEKKVCDTCAFYKLWDRATNMPYYDWTNSIE
jgi:hypothetical protein